MSRRVTFKTLWLISERDRVARKMSLSPEKTLLLGTNGTGKSRITKNLFWAFGCEPPKRVKGSWDPDTIAAVEFSFNGADYLVLRDGKRIGLVSSEGEVLHATDNMGNWDSFVGPFFGYQLHLQRPNALRFSQAGLSYLTLPFYLDQDGSWGADWDTYTNLGQFKNWKTAAFEVFTGLRPNAYFKAKQLRDEVHARLVDKRKELDAQRDAFSRVHEILPRNLPSLNTAAFRVELAELGRKALSIQHKQVTLRAKLIASVNLREKVHSELHMVVAAHREVVEDLTYLSDLPEGALECPTCGTIHQKSFHARLQLAQDADSMTALVAELNIKWVSIRNEEANLRSDLQRLEKEISGLDSIMHERKARLRLEDVLASHSKRTLDAAFVKVQADMGASIKNMEDEEDKHSKKFKKFENRDRVKKVRNYFGDQVVSLSNLLNVPGDEQIGKVTPSARAHAGGSSAPRSMLAVHLALLRTNVEHGDSPYFPFVVDTPQQSGQDDRNLRAMIEILEKSAGDIHQVVLAAEKLPSDVNISSFEVINFDGPKGALRAADFDATVERLSAPLRAIRERIASTSMHRAERLAS